MGLVTINIIFLRGIISGANLVVASKAVGGMWIAVGFLWLLMIPWACIMIFLVSITTN